MKLSTHKTIRVGLWASVVVLFACCVPVSAETVSVAIIDSGAVGYVDSAVSFTSYAADRDPLNHGTQIAKLVRQEFPSAKIYMLQVCEYDNGTLAPSPAAILKAIQWCARNNIAVVNMSIVIKYDQEIDRAISEASSRQGILFVAAGGNKSLASGFAVGQDGYICRVGKSSMPAFPASNREVISVGAVDPYGYAKKYSEKVCDVYDDGKIRGQEGTSFACARVAGKVAKILNEHGRQMKKMEIVASLVE